MCFHVTPKKDNKQKRVNGWVDATRQPAGHVGVVGRGRGAAEGYTLECSHSPSAAERDQAWMDETHPEFVEQVGSSFANQHQPTKGSLRNEEF